MNFLARFDQYARDFEATYVDDDWTRLEPYFTEDAVYEVRGLAAMGGRSEGREEAFAHLRRSVDGFDRRCLSRRIELTAPPRLDGNTVIVHWAATYKVEGGSELRFEGTEEATFAGDRIRELIDTYTPEMASAFRVWMDENGDKLRPAK